MLGYEGNPELHTMTSPAARKLTDIIHFVPSILFSYIVLVMTVFVSDDAFAVEAAASFVPLKVTSDQMD